jgi:hypothetical protein
LSGKVHAAVQTVMPEKYRRGVIKAATLGCWIYNIHCISQSMIRLLAQCCPKLDLGMLQKKLPKLWDMKFVFTKPKILSHYEKIYAIASKLYSPDDGVT